LKLCQNIFKSSELLKQDADVLEVEDERPFKKKFVAFINNDEMDWLKHEISNIKESMKEIAEHLGLGGNLLDGLSPDHN
jgi:hypothetical protein